MNITQEQIEAADHGEAVDISIDNTRLVLIRKDMYERMRALYDDSEWTESEMRAMACRAFDDADSAGPIE